jgi:hypothetical protein
MEKGQIRNTTADWGPWAADEYHLVSAADWAQIEKTGKYRRSEAKGAALLKLRAELRS